VDADAIFIAINKAKKDDAYEELDPEEKARIEDAILQLQTAYNTEDHHVIREKLDLLNEVTHHLAENMMNTAVRGALKGTKI
jgi:molecular chaperone DnaK